jgi:hypothetical protein
MIPTGAICCCLNNPDGKDSSSTVSSKKKALQHWSSLSEEGEERDNGCDGPGPRRGEPRSGAQQRRGCRGKAAEHGVLLQLPAGCRGRDEDEEHDGEEGGGHGDR